MTKTHVLAVPHLENVTRVEESVLAPLIFCVATTEASVGPALVGVARGHSFKGAAATWTVQSRAECPVKGSECFLCGEERCSVWAPQVDVELKHSGSSQGE